MAKSFIPHLSFDLGGFQLYRSPGSGHKHLFGASKTCATLLGNQRQDPARGVGSSLRIEPQAMTMQ